ncbi:ROK family protein [Mucilaginibacter agri]|uniref:ROK family protein n=1 Tax=Mucilaginibacter agri TaxID=2695265 RepID=A0A965ZGL0_9SPHI|nr:ROK family protein [Mucilaginibacter agri]NCD69614.1 ROK family protein [Mucilaginibacter agri]
MKNTSLAIGIDVGGTNTKYGIVNHRGDILEEGEMKTAEFPTIESFVDGLYDHLKSILDKYNKDCNIKGIGIGAPNGNHFTGCIENATNLHWKGIVPIAKLVGEKFKLPCVLNNDAKAAALGELNFGAAKGMKDFIMITLGTGVGSGIVVNGGLLYGDKGNAGELGHTIIRPGGRLHWSTGLKGTLESYCSATGIAITAVEMKKDSKEDTLLKNYDDKDITSKVVYECATKGDALAKKVYEFTGQILGEALSNFVMFSSPEAIILFGGVIQAGDLLMAPTKKAMEEHLLITFKGQVQLLFSELRFADAAILGASSLVWG